MAGRDHTFYVSATPGLGGLLAQEAEACLGLEVTRVTGGVEFTARLESLWQAALSLRLANRILVRLASFKAENFDKLERRIAEIPWELWLPTDADPEVVVTTHHCRLYHTDAVAQRVKGVVDQALPGGEGRVPQKIYLRGEDDRFTLSLDAAGEPLYKRGVKTHGGRAPIRETLASAILTMAGYTGDAPLADPMCGAGTFSLEAAMRATRTPPGLFRRFAFEQWPSFREKGFAHMKREAEKAISDVSAPVIFASDLDQGAVDRLGATLAELPFGKAVGLRASDFFSLDPASVSSVPGVVVFNPPYGKRIKGGNDAFVQRLLDHLAAHWGGWTAALAVPKQQVPRPMPRGFHGHPMSHGGLDLTVIIGRLP
ncbi:THUMP domain-containing class I SAM-dependent RNA methyltransferase [Desulfoluna spongiiphila]|uniref:Putative N6-adenine-specific DNA methylase n=1 Tax=Desulfoluna spongiiphila TaxID=419481 RepID=A0A1G5I2B3_9BACT|nr:RNA methyltransferase [Desulfoluna spongiiphila]SCY70196.1 putative N6-adenine-specific DNA methylase [Desulfoluna spongiiphila]